MTTTRTETVYATFKTRKGAENRVARDQAWLQEGTDWERIPNKGIVRVSTTTLEVRKADDGTFQVIRVTEPVSDECACLGLDPECLAYTGPRLTTTPIGVCDVTVTVNHDLDTVTLHDGITHSSIILTRQEIDALREIIAPAPAAAPCAEHLVRSNGTCVHCGAQVDVDEDDEQFCDDCSNIGAVPAGGGDSHVDNGYAPCPSCSPCAFCAAGEASEHTYEPTTK